MKTALAIAALAATLMGTTTAFADEPAKITVGYLDLVNAQLVTKHLGLIAKELPGVEVDYLKFGGGGDMLRGIAANQVDFGGIGNPPTAIGVTRGLPIQGTFAINMIDYVEALVVRSSANINSLKDLVGKRIAAPFGSTTHYLLMQALSDAGIDPASMQIIDLAPQDISLAWSRGDIDAAWFWEPNLNKAVEDGGKILMTSGEMAEKGYPTWDVGVVMNDFAANYPDVVVKVVKAECEGIDYWIAHPEETAQIIADELELSLEDATRMMKGTAMVPCSEQLTGAYLGTPGNIGQFADTLESTAKFLVSQDRLPKLLTRDDFAAFINPSYIEKAVAAE